MIYLNIHEAKTHFSRYLEKVENGETIVLCRRNTPVAHIKPLLPRQSEKRPIGLSKGTFSVTASFFDPLPEEFVSAFDGA